MAWERESKTSEQDAVVGVAVVGKAVVGFSATVWNLATPIDSSWAQGCTFNGSSGIAGLTIAGCMIAGGVDFVDIGWEKEEAL